MTDAEFAARVIAMQDTLYRVSTTILPRLCDREDAVQSAIEKALRRRGRLRDAAALEKWLTRILINECYTIHRRRRREVLCGDPAARETAPDADADLYRLFTSLPEAYRLTRDLVLVLHYVEGYAVSEVADMLRLGVNTVKVAPFCGDAGSWARRWRRGRKDEPKTAAADVRKHAARL